MRDEAREGDFAALKITERDGDCEFAVKVVPGASRSAVLGLLGDALKLAVAAPPEGGKANQAVCELLARVLCVPRRSIEIVSGATQPRKRVRVQAEDAGSIRNRLVRFLD